MKIIHETQQVFRDDDDDDGGDKRNSNSTTGQEHKSHTNKTWKTEKSLFSFEMNFEAFTEKLNKHTKTTFRDETELIQSLGIFGGIVVKQNTNSILPNVSNKFP